MKKIILFVTICVAISCSPVMADLITSGGASDFVIGGGTDATTTALTETLTIGLSNNVTVAYEDGDVNRSQWYATAAAHLGGRQTYGTAQDVSNLYKLITERTPGTIITATTFSGMPSDSASSNVWSTTVWEKL